jgi:dynamin 1-like protein
MQHIQHTLPHLKHRLTSKLGQVEGELKVLNTAFESIKPSFGTDATSMYPRPKSLAEGFDDPAQMQNVLLNIIRLFGATIKQLIDGHDGDVASDAFDVLGLVTGKLNETSIQSSLTDGKVSKKGFVELSGSVRIKYIFQELFPRTLLAIESVLLSSCMDDEIRTIIHNVRGLRAGLFVPDAVFEILIKRHILKMESPAMECIDSVYDELVRMIQLLLKGPTSPVRSFPRLQDWMLDETIAILGMCRQPTVEEVKRLIMMEVGYINTGHPDFLGTLFIRSRNNERAHGINKVYGHGTRTTNAR